MLESHALLLTDVVDSTQITGQLGDAAMAALWLGHDRLARDLLRQWRGIEIDKSDGFLLLFDTVADAAAYALAYHRAIATLTVPLCARAGLHVGPLQLRENNAADIALGAKRLEVEGLAKPVAARIMALAGAGQTLLSAAAAEALAEPPGRLASHGHWRLKGLDEPLELFEIGDGDAPFMPPPDGAKGYRVVRSDALWLPLREVRHNLPAERNAFVGRRDALQALAHRFEGGARLVALLGIGGTGKTRLAQHFGWTWLGSFPGGVWFCDLAASTTLDGVLHAVAKGLDLPLGRNEPVAQIGRAIAGRGACLAILDNFEQVARHAEASLGQWLDQAPQARFLVTTREVLGLRGEEALALPPLPNGDAQALFMRRAAAASPGFNPGALELAAVGPLVDLLDGLPLAIELAAARVRLLSPRALLARMGERFKLLVTAGGRHDRQATLRATLDWSWDLLAPAEKAALAQLSVFEGGFSLDSAEAVIALDDSDDAPWVIDVLQSLVDKSLLKAVNAERWCLLVCVQDYAAEQLATASRFAGSGPAALAAARARHWQHLAGWDEAQATADRCAETANLVVACRRAATAGDADAAARLNMLAYATLRLTGPYELASELANRVAALPDLPPAELANCHWVRASVLALQGQGAAAMTEAERGLVQAALADDGRAEARLRTQIGSQLGFRGEPEAASQQFKQALELARMLQAPDLELAALNGLGSMACDHSQLDLASQHLNEALALAYRLGDLRWQGGLHGNLGNIDHSRGGLDAAAEHYALALELAARCGDRRFAGNTRCNLGWLLQEQGKTEAARREFDAALSEARDLGQPRLEATVLCNLAIAAEEAGDLAAAGGQYAQSMALMRQLGDPRGEGEFSSYLGKLLARQGRFDEARQQLAVGQALLEKIDHRLGLGLLACARSETEWLAGERAPAEAALAVAERLAAALCVTADSELARWAARLRAEWAA